MFKAIIIGCGQLGSRHLQSLCKVNFPIHITVVDLYEASLATAKDRASEALSPLSKVDLSFFSDLNKVANGNFDLAILATNSDSRFAALKDLIKQNRVSHVLFEKFLFQNRSDYPEALALLKLNDIQGWVNTSRRMFPEYQKWIQRWRELGPFEYRLDGGNWGLACNMVHHLDFYQHITGETVKSINMDRIEPKPVPAKRKGFFEFYGELWIEMSKGGRVILIAQNTDVPPLVRLKFAREEFFLDESKGIITVGAREEAVRIPFQSELTQLVATAIRTEKKIQLPSYEVSMDYHLRLFDSFSEFSQKNGLFREGFLPIT